MCIRDRYCAYCPAGPGGSRAVDTEAHCLTRCVVGSEQREELFSSISSNISGFSGLSDNDKFLVLVCPSNPVNCKLVSRYLQLQFTLRDSIDTGECRNPT